MQNRLDGDATALAKVLAAVPEVVVVVDLKGTILYINRVEEAWDREQVIGLRAESIMPPESQATFRSALEAIGRGARQEEYDLEASGPGGQTQHYRSRMLPIHDGDAVVGAVVIAENITELRSAQAELVQLRRLLPL